MANEFKTEEELLKEVEEAREKVVVGGYYAHYKHPGEKRYQVIDVAIFENTEEVCVLYESLEMGVIWIRTLDNFLEEVRVGGKIIRRFTPLEA